MLMKLAHLTRAIRALIALMIAFSRASLVGAEPLEPVDSSMFIQTDGTRFRAPDGSVWIGRGVAFGNSVWSNPQSPSSFRHHRMSDYARAREMGFNSVRFYLNYALFESDASPGKYKEEGFEWIDRNVEAAKANGVSLVLNMHYPQGGFQSNGNGDALWKNEKNQDRLVALWREIARRYRAEPAIAGYGPLNEPVPVNGLGEWESLAQRIIDAIRETDVNHIIFVERAIWVKSGGTEKDRARLFFPERLRDPSNRLALEFHFYEPMGFSHQNTSWTRYKGQFARYPDDSRVELEGGRWAGFSEAGKPLPSGTFDWQEAGGNSVEPANPEWLVAYPVLQAQGLGERGRVWLEGLVVEASTDGGATYGTIGTAPGTTLDGWGFWSVDGSGSHDLRGAPGSSGPRLSVAGTKSDANVTFSAMPIVLKPGVTYRLAGRVRGTSVAPGAVVRLRLDYHAGTSISSWNREFLESALRSYVDYSRERGLPLYLGEFGIASDAFRENRGGLAWIEDMLDLLVSNDISYNYHTWRESPFGIHQHDDGYADPARMNKPLVEALKRLQAVRKP